MSLSAQPDKSHPNTPDDVVNFDALLDLLNHGDGEFTAICHEADGIPFNSQVTDPHLAPEVVAGLPDDSDIWFSVNPTTGPARKKNGRGTAADVTRLAALFADLDVKDGGCADYVVAQEIIDDLSKILDTGPMAITYSGHGVQPYWPCSDGAVRDDGDWDRIDTIIKRWGSLVEIVAKKHGAHADSIFNLDRILRVPETVNNKFDPVPVVCYANGGRPLSLDEIALALNSCGIESPIPDGISDRSSYGIDSESSDAEIREWAKTTFNEPDSMCYAMQAATEKRIESIRTEGQNHPHLRDGQWETLNLALDFHTGWNTALIAVEEAHYDEVVNQRKKRSSRRVLTEINSARDRGLRRLKAVHDQTTRIGEPSTTGECPWCYPSAEIVEQWNKNMTRQLSNLANSQSNTAGGLDRSGQVRMADRFAKKHLRQFIYVYGIGWHYWDGTRWAFDNLGRTHQAVHKVLRAAWMEAFAMTDKDKQKRLIADVKKCESSNGLDGVLRVAAKMKEFAVRAEDLDADPYLLNVANGTVDLYTLELRPHDPADLITKITKGAYRPEISTIGALWNPFLERILPDKDVREFAQRLAGLSLIGRKCEDILVILNGDGNNGKSKYEESMRFAMGDYAIETARDLLTAKEGSHTTAITDLRGVRWASVNESEKNIRLNEAAMKALTGNSTQKARRMRENNIEWPTSHTLFLITNFLPKVSGDDPAVWRRVKIVPFDVVIPDEEQDKKLGEKLELEADVILSWALHGAVDYLKGRGEGNGDGLREPEAVRRATAAYHRASDDVSRFMDEKCLTGNLAGLVCATTTELHEVWNDWQSDNHCPPMLLREFGRTLDNRGHPAGEAVHGKRYRQDIGLKSRNVRLAQSLAQQI